MTDHNDFLNSNIGGVEEQENLETKAAPTRASSLCKLVCTNCLTTAVDGTSMWRKLSGCSSYVVNFF